MIIAPVIACIFAFPKDYHWFIVAMGKIGGPVSFAIIYLFGFTKWMFLQCGLANNSEVSDDELDAELLAKLQKLKID